MNKRSKRNISGNSGIIAGIEGSMYAEKPRTITIHHDDFTPGCTELEKQESMAEDKPTAAGLGEVACINL